MKFKFCCYRTRDYNLLPAIIVTPLDVLVSYNVSDCSHKLFGLKPAGLRIAFRFWNFRLGAQVMHLFTGNDPASDTTYTKGERDDE